jgi:GT2 family glycosyltransferase
MAPKKPKTTPRSKSPKKQPFISIIIPVRNAGRTLEETFVYLFGGKTVNGQSIRGIKYPTHKMEVIVADGDSTDNTVVIIKNWQKKCKCIRSAKIPKCESPGQARNAALKMVKGDYILFTDGDCAPNPDWVDKLLQPFFKDPEIGMVGGEVYALQLDPANKVEHYCQQVSFLSVGDRMNLKNGGYYPPVVAKVPREVNGSQTCPFFTTANMAVSRKAVLAIGNNFWNEITSEDVDFSLRIGKAGFKLYFQPSAVVRHMHRASLQQFCRQVWDFGLCHPLTIKTHAKRALEFRLQYFDGKSLVIPFPFQTMIYWGDFHFMHLFGVWTLIQTLSAVFLGDGLGDVNILLWVFFLGFLFKYFLPVLKIQPASDFLLWSWIRYRSNWAMFLGGLKGSLKFGRLYIEMSW